MTRAEKVAEARRLRAQGLTFREVGEQMGGYKVSTVHAWLSDPDRSLEVARKDSYRGACVDCGAPTSGSDGRGPNAPQRCSRCQVRRVGSLNIERAKPQRELIERLWAEGKTSREIGEVVGWDPEYASQMICSCRHRGYDLPYRRPAADIEKLSAALVRARAARGVA